MIWDICRLDAGEAVPMRYALMVLHITVRVSGSWSFWKKEGKGLNLTWSVRDGILNHRTAGSPEYTEGQVVRLCGQDFVHPP